LAVLCPLASALKTEEIITEIALTVRIFFFI